MMIRARRLICLTLLLVMIASCALAVEPKFLPLAEGENEILPIDLTPGFKPAESGYLSDWSYVDSSISVNIEEMEVENTRVLVAWVTIADPSQLRSAPAYDFKRDHEDTVENMANRMQAVVTINGDYCSYLRSTQGSYLMRMGTLYLDRPIVGRDTLLIDDKGDFYTLTNKDKNTVKEVIGDKTIINAANFGPALIRNGERLTDEYSSTFTRSWEKHQRSAICQMEHGKNQYVLVVCEGLWSKPDTGLTMAEWGVFLQSLGVQEAYNLDGGNSTAMVFRGQKLNEPGNPHHRKLSDIFYFASAAVANKE